jgi:hypothetical protein
VVLSSSEHSYTIATYSNNLRKRKRTKRKIKARKNGHLLPFDAITFTGNCCWKVRDKFTAGQSFVVPGVGTHHPGWLIRAVQLVDNCNLNWNGVGTLRDPIISTLYRFLRQIFLHYLPIKPDSNFSKCIEINFLFS